MKLAALAVALSAAACTSEAPATDLTTGTWERYDDQGRVIDHLALDSGGSFESSCIYYWPIGPALLGDYSYVRGTYEVAGDHVNLHGTTRDGYPFHLTATYAADDKNLSLGAYLPVADNKNEYAAVYDLVRENSTGLDWNLRPTMWLFDVDSGAASYMLDYIDPVWETHQTEGGDLAPMADGSFMLEDVVHFGRLDHTALGRDEAFHRCLDYAPMPLDAGITYERVDLLE